MSISSAQHRGYKRQRGLALSILIVAMLSLFGISAEAQTAVQAAAEEEIDTLTARTSIEQFDWHVQAELDANYIFRGEYVGGLSWQGEAEVSYYGFFLNAWWNIGATDWYWGKKDATGKGITELNPEVDISVGYRYKGLTLLFMQMYYFDCYADGSATRFFDYGNYPAQGGGITTEWRVRYSVSPRVPLYALFCIRTFGRDGYIQDGQLVRAYSSYIELGYTPTLHRGYGISACVGGTPYKSNLTGYEKDAAIVNIKVGATKTWQITDYCGMYVGGVAMYNPAFNQWLWNVCGGVRWGR